MIPTQRLTHVLTPTTLVNVLEDDSERFSRTDLRCLSSGIHPSGSCAGWYQSSGACAELTLKTGLLSIQCKQIDMLEMFGFEEMSSNTNPGLASERQRTEATARAFGLRVCASQ